MRSLYRIFDRYLPRDNYNQEPIFVERQII